MTREDVIQAVLVQVAAKPKFLIEAANPWHYLIQMVRNQSLTVLRNKKRTKLVANLCDLITRRRVDELEQEETYRAIWAALRKLPLEQSEIVVLKIWEDLTFDQIGSLLDIPPSTAASRYRYAMEKLTRHFGSKQGRAIHE